jgi:hypothetical protein
MPSLPTQRDVLRWALIKHTALENPELSRGLVAALVDAVLDARYPHREQAHA